MPNLLDSKAKPYDVNPPTVFKNVLFVICTKMDVYELEEHLAMFN